MAKITPASALKQVEVATDQFHEIQKDVAWKKIDIEASLYEPTKEVTRCVGVLEFDRSFKKRWQSKIVQIFSVGVGLGVLLGFKFFRFTKIPSSEQIMKFMFFYKIMNVLDTVETEIVKFTPRFEELKFILSGGGGNICGTLLKQLEKLSYIEYRIQDASMMPRDVKRPKLN